MPRFKITGAAEDDLLDIWEYIAEDNESAADKLLRGLNTKFHALSEQPGIGRERFDLIQDIRSFAFGRYVIFYRITHYGIEITRVLHGSRDLASIEF